jgi:hypothetical protein
MEKIAEHAKIEHFKKEGVGFDFYKRFQERSQGGIQGRTLRNNRFSARQDGEGRRNCQDKDEEPENWICP